MKRKFCLVFMGAASMLAINSASAQIAKGSVMLGGNVGFNTSKNEAFGTTVRKENSFYISPAVGVAIKENLFVGGDLAYRSNTQENNGAGKTTNNGFGIGAFVRQYKNLGKSGFYLFGQGRLGADITHVKSGSTTTNNGFAIGLGLTPGISYAVNSKLHLETSLANLFSVGYNSSKNKGADIKSNSFSADVNLGSLQQWNVGIRFILAK